jgi:hypothetical protein
MISCIFCLINIIYYTFLHLLVNKTKFSDSKCEYFLAFNFIGRQLVDSSAFDSCDQERHHHFIVVFDFDVADSLCGVSHEAFDLKGWRKSEEFLDSEERILTMEISSALGFEAKTVSGLGTSFKSPEWMRGVRDGKNRSRLLTIILDVVDLNAVPLMSQPLRIKLRPVIVLALFQQMRVQSCDIDNIAVKTKSVDSNSVNHSDL